MQETLRTDEIDPNPRIPKGWLWRTLGTTALVVLAGLLLIAISGFVYGFIQGWNE